MPLPSVPITPVPAEGDTNYPSLTAIKTTDAVAPLAANRQHNQQRTRTNTLRDRVNTIITVLDFIETGGAGSLDYYLPRDGTVPMSGDLDMDNNSILDVEAISMNSGGSGIDMNGKKVTDMGTPTAAADAATKAYVDSAVSGAGATYRKRNRLVLVGARDGVGGGEQTATYTMSAFAADEVRAQSTPPEELWLEYEVAVDYGGALETKFREMVKIIVELNLNATSSLSTFRLYAQQVMFQSFDVVTLDVSAVPTNFSFSTQFDMAVPLTGNPVFTHNTNTLMEANLLNTTGIGNFTNESDTELRIAYQEAIGTTGLFIKWLHTTRQWEVRVNTDATTVVQRFRLTAVSEKYVAIP